LKKACLIFLAVVLIFVCVACGSKSSQPIQEPTSNTGVINSNSTSTKENKVDWNEVPVTEMNITPFIEKKNTTNRYEKDENYDLYIEGIMKIDGIPTLNPVDSDKAATLYELNENVLTFGLYTHETTDDDFTEVAFAKIVAMTDIRDVFLKRITSLKEKYADYPDILEMLETPIIENYYNNMVFIVSKNADKINQYFKFYYDPMHEESPFSKKETTNEEPSVLVDLYMVAGEVLEVGKNYAIINFLDRHTVKVFYPKDDFLPLPRDLRVGDIIRVALDGVVTINSNIDSFDVQAGLIVIESDGPEPEPAEEPVEEPVEENPNEEPTDEPTDIPVEELPEVPAAEEPTDNPETTEEPAPAE
jgi:hypothetical protein